jgi:preprotein translocase subunit SecB|tara:strand:+ start:190 stop:606 length:417 start_codon:yes stop_codon:yes gene_type:complete
MNYKIIAQYIKDIKFDIPNPKIFFELSKNISDYKIQIDIKSNQFKENIIEVETTLTLNPTKTNFQKINTKIIYSSIVEVDNKISSKNDLEKIILIDVPGEIYSNLRKIFVFIFESSGFKNIKIDKNIDFQKLYNQKKN